MKKIKNSRAISKELMNRLYQETEAIRKSKNFEIFTWVYNREHEQIIGRMTDDEKALFTLAIRYNKSAKAEKSITPAHQEALHISQLLSTMGYQHIGKRLKAEKGWVLGIRKGGLIVRDLVEEHAHSAFAEIANNYN